MNTKNRSSSSSAATRKGLFIGGGLLVAAVIVALIVALSGGDDGTAISNEASRIPSGSVRQVSAADIDGQPLPRYDASLVTDPAAGMQAPSITASYFDDTEITVDTADGTPRIVMFLAHWCPHCQAEVNSLSDWFAENGPLDDVEVIAVSTDVDDGAPNYPPSDWFLREQWPVPVLRDSNQNDLAAGYGLSGFPFMVIIDGEGKVVSRWSGGTSIPQWEAFLAAAVGASSST